MKLNHIIVTLCITLICCTNFCMEQGHYSDDEAPSAMTSSLIILSKLGQQLSGKPPVIADLQKLCKAADQCTQNIHRQLLPLFRACNLPLSTHQEPSELVIIYDQSPINEFLKTLQLIDPQERRAHSPVIEDYLPGCQEPSPAAVAQEHSNLPLQEAQPLKECVQQVTPQEPLSDEQKSGITHLFSTAIAYPLHPFATVFAFVKKQVHIAKPYVTTSSTQEPISTQQNATCMPHANEQDPSIINQSKYQKVLSHGKQLLKQVTTDQEARTLLKELKRQLERMQATIAENIERIETDRASFNNLQQCVCPADMTLNDMLLLQYSKMSVYNASPENALGDFKLQAKRITDVTQEQFEDRWQAIQEMSRSQKISAQEYDKLRQYTYLLQNVTVRYLAQRFLDGTINTYGMTADIARERGLTTERIAQLTTELSNCKDFLLQLKRAFADSLKLIEKAMRE